MQQICRASIFHELKKAFPIDKAAFYAMEIYNFSPSQEFLTLLNIIMKTDKKDFIGDLFSSGSRIFRFRTKDNRAD